MSSDYIIKYGALALLVIQNAAVALVTSYSRNIDGPKYFSTTAGEATVYSNGNLLSNFASLLFSIQWSRLK